MGSSVYSGYSGSYSAATAVSTASSRTFSYSHTVGETHPDLNVNGKIRESRDSVEHPESVPVLVLLDVTGSMQGTPITIRDKFPSLFGAITMSGALEHPQVCIGAIGDVKSDRSPLQVGQFESDNAADDFLDKIHMEGNGGGNSTESYELALYYAAYGIAHDAYEKRGKAGYLFIIGDEALTHTISRDELRRVTGQAIEKDIQFSAILPDLLDRWDVYVIRPAGTNNYSNPHFHGTWTEIFGDHVIRLESAELIVEQIVACISAAEEIDAATVTAAMTANGATSGSTALVLRNAAAVTRAGRGGALVDAGDLDF